MASMRLDLSSLEGLSPQKTQSVERTEAEPFFDDLTCKRIIMFDRKSDRSRPSSARQIHASEAETKAEELRDKGNGLLTSEPMDAGEATAMWRQLEPLDLMKCKKYWVLADPANQRLDLKTVNFTQWVDDDGNHRAGMKIKGTACEHGVVRVTRA